MASKRLLVGLLLVALFSSTTGFDFRFPDVIKSTIDVSSGVVKSVSNKLPSPENLFDVSKQLIAGYPLEFVSTTINKICSLAISSQTISPKFSPDINQMKFQLRTACEKHSFPLLQANNMWTSPYFDPHKKVVILATGWSTKVNESDTIDVFAQAYNCRGDVNFVAIDVASFVNTLYTWSAFNTEDLGLHIARGLEKLSCIVPVKNIHLIGHSLGSHIMGSAGRNFQLLTNKTIPRITGLDPAKPCFNEGEALSGLLRGDADFIDIIHSNPGVLGKRDPLGDVDFYPGGLDPLPNGCVAVTCAHERAWQYYVETVYPGNEFNFLGARCNSLTSLREGKCINGNVAMGYAVPANVKGNYFLEVKDLPPYGMNGNKHRSVRLEECGKCLKNKN